MSVFLLIVGIVLFIGLILVHEWGHFIAAKRGGVDVEEYSVFFPPKIYKKRMKGGWDFVIGALPLGGYVKLKGETDSDTAPGSLGAASLWTKTKIMGAGVFMNLVVAYLMLVVIALLGMPKLLSNQFTLASDTKVVGHAQHHVQVTSVQVGSPAARAGLKAGDLIEVVTPLTAAGEPAAAQARQISGYRQLQAATKAFAGQKVSIKYQRKTDQKITTAQLNTAASQNTAHPSGYLGVALSDVQQGSELRRSTWSAPIVAAGLTWQFTAVTLQGLGHAVSGLGSLIAGFFTHNTVARQHGQTAAADQVSGPIGIVVVLHYVSSMGYQFTLLIVALISLTLAIMNFLPIPALDGGRLWLTLIYRGILKRPLPEKLEATIGIIGLVVLLGLSVVIAFVDVKRFL